VLTLFELSYVGLEPFLPPLHRLVRRELLTWLRGSRVRARLLDVGGRNSHVTIGLPADVTVTDVARVSHKQRNMNLGIDDDMVRRTRRRRSNIRDVVVDDMTQSELPSRSFDVVVAVEVLEHVEEDDAFVSHVARILRPGGLFLMTTPNGDFIPRTNRDHKRHYKRSQLESLLSAHFDDVKVWYGIRLTPARRRGLASWSPRRPLRTLASIAGNLVNYKESMVPGVSEQATGTCHLLATARARKPEPEH
jgi:SAM-dependent methyltransferase